MRNNASIDSSSRSSPPGSRYLGGGFPCKKAVDLISPNRTLNHIVKYPTCISVNQMVNQSAVTLDLDAIFAALAHPIRRAILEQLAAGDATLGELAEPYDVSLPAISRHLRVLEDAGLLQVEPERRVRRCQIEVGPLSAAFGWLTRYRVLWEDRFARLDEHLKEIRDARGKEEHKHARKK